MPGMSMPGMSSSVDLNEPHESGGVRDGLAPSSSPMYGKMVMGKDGDMLMLHGAVMPRYVNVGSERGDPPLRCPQLVHGHVQPPIRCQVPARSARHVQPRPGHRGRLRLPPCCSRPASPGTTSPCTTAEHPHDLVSELAATYSHLLGGGKSAYLYLGYPGEPALGPPTYMPPAAGL